MAISSSSITAAGRSPLWLSHYVTSHNDVQLLLHGHKSSGPAAFSVLGSDDCVIFPSFGDCVTHHQHRRAGQRLPLSRPAPLPQRQAPPRHLLSRPRPGTYTNAPYDRDPTSQQPGAPNPTAVWHGKMAMWALSEDGRWFERGQAVGADAQPWPHHAGDVARREWCGLMRRSSPACTNACLRGP